MTQHDDKNEANGADRFSREAEEAPPGLIAEFRDFLLHNKKWWLTPIVIVMLLTAGLVLLTGTGLAPLIYTLF